MSLFNAQWLAGCIASPVPGANDEAHPSRRDPFFSHPITPYLKAKPKTPPERAGTHIPTSCLHRHNTLLPLVSADLDPPQAQQCGVFGRSGEQSSLEPKPPFSAAWTTEEMCL
jgi:hypothetical protein